MYYETRLQYGLLHFSFCLYSGAWDGAVICLFIYYHDIERVKVKVVVKQATKAKRGLEV